ncbi:helix-turn-helix domain-containing protein [Nesterenkonia sp. F]|uniref:helix-turn-helix domain-containing protein n=1 Tax=Nesterenkonia sp. F TaxID=795955 RepID=UPI001ED8FAAD|nr:helix-turn-helix domain-containing protein [Nesterenkonia sp. F]
MGQVEEMPAALWVRRGAPPRMSLPHQHDDLEINIVLEGAMEYLFGGTPVTVQAGEVAVFWAAVPHRLIGSCPGDVCWIHLPLSTVLSWSLPESDVRVLLSRDPVIVPRRDLPGDVVALFEAWRSELTGEHGEAALLEAQAFVRRVMARRRLGAARHRGSDGGDLVGGEMVAVPPAGEAAPAVSHAVAMARCIASRFREPLTVDDVAASVHLSSGYAMSVFKEALAMTMGDYLVRCRVAEAQRLLITTSHSAGEVAHEAGFSSQSSFYAHFSRVCGCPPAEYRRRLR